MSSTHLEYVKLCQEPAMSLDEAMRKLPCPDGSRQFLAGVKKILQDFTASFPLESKDGINSNLALLVKLYLTCPSRLAAKRAMASFFQGLDDSLQKEFEIQLCVQLQSCFVVDRTQDNINLSTRQCVDNVNSLMENFKLGEKCLVSIFTSVMSFLVKAVRRFLSGCGPDVPPIGLNEVMLNCHVTMQTINLVLQKTVADCPEKVNELLAMPEHLSNLMDLDTEIIHNDLFLLDCRCCCAMNVFLLLQLALPVSDMVPSLLFPKPNSRVSHSHPDWLSDSLAGKLSLDSAPPLTFLTLTFGYIAMVTIPNMSHDSLGDGKFFYIDILLPKILHIGKSCENTPSKTLFAKTVNLWTTKLLSAMEQEAVRDLLANKMRGTSDADCGLLEYVWTHWEDQLDVLHQSAKTVFENVLKLHVKACFTTGEDSTPFIQSLLDKVLAVSWSSRGKFSSLTSCVQHVGASVLLTIRPSIVEEVLLQHQEQAVSCYASELYSCLYLSHRKELTSTHGNMTSNEKVQPSNNLNTKQPVTVPVTKEQHSTLMEVWIQPVIQAMHAGHRKWKQNVIEYLLPKLMKNDLNILDFMIEKMSSTKESQSDVIQAYGAIVMCLRRARAIGLLKSKPMTAPNGLWFGILNPSILKSTLCSLNEQIRLDAFALLCENCKTSEAISSFEFEMLQLFIPYNVNSQSPAFRQSFLSLLKKLFFRLKESLGLLNRLALRKDLSSPMGIIRNYDNFLSWLTHFLLNNIYPGSTFARRTTCLACLALLTSFFSNSKDGFSVPNFITEDHLQTLLECMTDTFEENRKEALNMLTIYTNTVGSLSSSEKLKMLLDISLTLACSTKPQDCGSAAYLFNFLLKQPEFLEFLKAFQPSLKSDKLTLKFKQLNSAFMQSALLSPESKPPLVTKNLRQSMSTIYLLKLLCLLLDDQIELAYRSLVTAAATSPMYPTLHCIRYILQYLNWSSLTDDLFPLAKDFIDDLIHTCLNLAKVVSPVVQNSSPEGNIPADAILNPDFKMSEIIQTTRNEEDGEARTKVEAQILSTTVTDEDKLEAKPESQTPELAQTVILSQILVEAMPEYLVVCCWRSIKEVSLVLGKLCLQIPISKIGQSLAANTCMSHAPSSLLSLAQVETMGTYFTHQLLESIHRGAFELAYAGFQLMCHMLWSHLAPEFHKLPSLWLQQVMMDIKSPESKLCATRRSAGVPFFVQAITSSEPPATGRKCFHSCIQELLVLAIGQRPVSKDHTDAQVHALNILRTLYRDTRLGEDVVPYVAEGLKAAVLGFKADLWAVRNSATLLLSALMTRIFGVKRSKDESTMSKKNCLTGRVFFHRYPSLYPFLLSELESATASVGRQDVIQLHPSLYPILLVLGRLFPSTLEGSDTSLSLSAFIPYILKCASSPVYKTRVIAARALQPLAKRVQVTQIMEKLLDSFPSSPSSFTSISSNLLHGSLLQLHQLMKLVTSLNDSHKVKELTIFVSKFKTCSWLLSKQNPCCATQQEMLKLIDATLDASGSINSAPESFANDVRCMESFFLSSLADTSTKSLKWRPFYFDLEKTKAALIVKHLHSFAVCKELKQQKEKVDLEGSDVNQEESIRNGEILECKQKIVLNLLNSPFYEARLEALNGMIVAMESHSSSGFKEQVSETDFADNEMSTNNDCDSGLSEVGENPSCVPANASHERKTLTTDLMAGLFDSILTLAMEKEDHHECVEKVFHVLAIIPDCASLLRNIGCDNLNKVFSVLLQKIETERRTQVKASMLRFSSRIVPLIYAIVQTIKENQEELNHLTKWINLLTRYSRSDANPQLQLSVASCLMENCVALLCDNHHKLGTESLHCWDVMAILLQADDLEVKDIASSALAIACSQHQDAFHPCYALHKLPEFLVSIQGKLGFNKLFKCLMSWVLLEETCDEQECEERLFEKGEMNTYWDQITFSRSVAQVLSSLIKRLQDEPNSCFGGQNLDITDLENFITTLANRILHQLESFTDNTKMSDSLINPGKYNDVYQAIHNARILQEMFMECQSFDVTLPSQFSNLEDVIYKLKKNLNISG